MANGAHPCPACDARKNRVEVRNYVDTRKLHVARMSTPNDGAVAVKVVVMCVNPDSGKYVAMLATNADGTHGVGQSMDEAIVDFLKVTKRLEIIVK